MKFRDWFQMMTLGHPGKYLRLMAWCLFDSIVMSVPYGLNSSWLTGWAR